MDSLTFVEVHELINANLEYMNYQFQNWLTITFATIVAAFAARNHLSRKMKYLVSSLYLIATLTCVTAYYSGVVSNIELAEQLLSNPHDPTLKNVATVSRLLLFAFGVVTTLIFIHKSVISDPR
jgi:hypothetical protein